MDGAIPNSGPVTFSKVAALDLSGVNLRRGCDDKLKPEAIAVLADIPDAYRILVRSDGMCDGGRLEFWIEKSR
jgi:hypothetical protein